MNTLHRHSRLFGPLCALAAGLALAGTAFAADSAVEPGNWQPHKVTFNYIGISPTYSCEGLEQNLSYLLSRAGARMDGPVLPVSCNRGPGQPSPLSAVKLQFSNLTPAADADSNAGGATVPGSWRQVTIEPQNSDFTLQGGDCELVEEFKDVVLPLLTVRNVKSNLFCVPHQTTGFQFSLSFQVFAPSGVDHS